MGIGGLIGGALAAVSGLIPGIDASARRTGRNSNRLKDLFQLGLVNAGDEDRARDFARGGQIGRYIRGTPGAQYALLPEEWAAITGDEQARFLAGSLDTFLNGVRTAQERYATAFDTQIQETAAQIQERVRQIAFDLNLSSSIFDDFTHDIEFSAAGLTQTEVVAKVEEILGAYSNALSQLVLDAAGHDGELAQAGTDLENVYDAHLRAITHVTTAVTDSAPTIGEAAEAVDGLTTAIERLAVAATSSTSALGTVPSFHDGGMVPGRRGQEILALLEGGERVIPAGGGGQGGDITVVQNVTGDVDQAVLRSMRTNARAIGLILQQEGALA